MKFKRAVWYPIATVLSVVNLASVWFAAAPGQALHATVHAALAVAFGLWAQHLRTSPTESELQERLEALGALKEFEAEANLMREELRAAQERIDFGARLSAERPDAPRVDERR